MSKKKLTPEAIQLLETVIEVIKIDPSLLDMSSLFYDDTSTKEGFIEITFEGTQPKVNHSCGSVCCIAGTICAIKERKLALENLVIKGENIADRATTYLGLKSRDTYSLFYSDLVDCDRVTNLKIGTPEYIEATINTIRTFIETDGKNVGDPLKDYRKSEE